MTQTCGSCKRFKPRKSNEHYGDCDAPIPKSTICDEGCDCDRELSNTLMQIDEGSDCQAWAGKDEFCEWQKYTPINPQPFDCYESKNHEQKRFFGDVNKFCCECGKPIKVKESN